MLDAARSPLATPAVLLLTMQIIAPRIASADDTLPEGMVQVEAPAGFLNFSRFAEDDTSFTGGTSYRHPERAVAWTPAEGFVILPPGPRVGSAQDKAWSRLDDGTYFGTQRHYGSGDPPDRLLVWTGDNVTVLTGSESDRHDLEITRVSRDGTTIVGYAGRPGDPFRHAWRWTANGGYTDLLALPGGDPDSLPTAASDDAMTVVGASTDEFDFRPVAWFDGATEATHLGSLAPDDSCGIAYDVSADGRTVVGTSEDADGISRAFRWTAETGMTELPGMSEAYWVGGDGSWVFGVLCELDPPYSVFEVVWSPDRGTISSEAWLAERGFALPAEWFESGEWRLWRVSRDSRTVLFLRRAPDGPWAWYHYRLDGTCVEDLDASGSVASGDLFAVLEHWDGPDGDIDGDGTTGFGDLAAVLGAWGPCR